MHDPRIRERARELYEQHGAAYAAEQTGVPRRSIDRWAAEEGWTRRLTGLASHTDPKTQSHALAWETRRRREADAAGSTAGVIREVIERQVRSARRLPLRDLAVAYGIFIDKAELLGIRTGGADYREVSAEQQVARLVELVDVAEQREAGGGGHG
jgi:hypothetical protein